MHYTPKEVDEIDIAIILNDFSMWSIEAEVSKVKQEIEEDKQRTAEKNSQNF